MFWQITSFEVRYHLRNPVFWATFTVFFLLTFATVTAVVGTSSNIHKNAPSFVAQICGDLLIFAMFTLATFVANAVLRDDESGFGGILRATRLKKFDYLFGRFTGAFTVAALAFAGAPLGLWIGSFMPWIDPQTLGATPLWDYVAVYFIVCVPSLFIVGAIFFALATATKSMMACYLGAVALLIGWIATGSVLNQPGTQAVGALVDPFGLHPLAMTTKYWTAVELNTKLPPLTGIFLYNRLLWTGMSLAFLGMTYATFRFEGNAALPGRKNVNAQNEANTEIESRPKPASVQILPRFDRSQRLGLLWARTRFEMAAIFKSPAFWVLMVLGLGNTLSGLWLGSEFYDTPVYPVTRSMIADLFSIFSYVNILIAIYYSGELVWRDRERRINGIIDSCPIPGWAYMLPKVLGITAVLAATNLLGVVGSVIKQALQGYYHFELAHYLLWYAVPVTILCAQLAILSILIQTLSPSKSVGWGLMGLFLISSLAMSKLGFQHNLYQYGGAPHVPLSDMNGEGRFWIGHAWFQFYWSAFAIFLAVLAHGLWQRGAETRLTPRIRRLPTVIAGPAGAIALVALLAFVGSGAFIFYNTNVLNDYRTRWDEQELQADLEKTLLPFEKVLQPHLTDIVADIDLHPHDAYATASGHYVVENRTGYPLSEVHLRWDVDLDMERLEVDGATMKTDYGRLHYRIFTFNRPMRPGEKCKIHFATRYSQNGFTNDNRLGDSWVVDNGTLIHSEIMPAIGMTRKDLLQDRAARRKYGLPPGLPPAKLEDDSARANSFLTPNADWVNSDITISTAADQIPIAPGQKVLDETKDGRRIVRFKSDVPISSDFSIQSAAYAVKTNKWNDVDLAIYCSPRHTWNIDRMFNVLKASLEVYSKAFGPYQYHQVHIVEFPAYRATAQSFANTIPYSEDIGFVTNVAAGKGIDPVTYVTAHEMGRQWWGNQVVGADMQGGFMMVGTLSQYSSMLVMEHVYGPDQMRKFLKMELDRYLRSRGGEPAQELPLARVEKQGYIFYDKGAVVMYYLKDLVGEDVVNGALRHLIADYGLKPAPYPSTKDFLRYLREGAGPKYDEAITDLFERITLYDVRVTNAVAKPDGAGKYTVTMDVDAHKYYADGHGKETEADLAIDMDIGLFDAEPGTKQFTKANVIHFASGAIKTGKQTIRVTADRLPTFAGVDPYNKLITRNPDAVLTSVSK